MTRRQKRNLKRIIASALLITAALFLSGFRRISVVILMLSYLISGYDVLWSAIRKIFSGQLFDEEILMSVATVCAVALGEFSEAGMVMTLYQLGELFQSIAVGKSRKSIKEMMKLKPERVTCLREGKEVETAPEDVKEGELILVLPGEKVALDGIIEEGGSCFDTSSLTGESVPVMLNAGKRVTSGMINLESPVKIKVESIYAESTVAKILNLIEASSAYKSASEKFITKFSRKYTPCVFFAALATALIPVFFFGQDFILWLRRALVFLIVSCPCALVISVPLSFFGAIGAASKKGILIKGSEYIETLAKTSVLAFDKTGTVTYGKFSVSQIRAFNTEEETLLEIAAYAESFSAHPIAASIVEKYGKEIDKDRIQNLVTVTGKGISALIDGKSVLVGNRTFMTENGIEFPDTKEESSIVYVACDNTAAGIIYLEDRIKPDSAECIRNLKKAGIKKSIMLTGDNEETALKVGKEIGADEVYARLLPQDKTRKILELKKENTVAFIGDGINDAPVLSCVDVGFAMGALGSDAAVEAADIVIMNDNLSAVEHAIALSKKTMKVVRQNIFLSLLVKFSVMILSVLGFDNMYAAIFADVGVMILAVLNAMRMMYNKRTTKNGVS